MKTKTAKTPKTCKVLVYRVGQPGVVEEVASTLKAHQALVGGYLQHLPVGDGLGLFCNEEGKFDDKLKPNFAIPGDVIVGDVFFSRADSKGETISVTDEDVRRVREMLGR